MESYYLNQAGSGLGGFAGYRYQKGDGFFGRLISGTVLPLIKKALPFLARTGFDKGIDMMRDVSEGHNFKESFKKRMKEAGEELTDKAIGKVKLVTGGRLVGGRATKIRGKRSAGSRIKQKGTRGTKGGRKAYKKKGSNRSTHRRIESFDFL